MSDGTVLLPFHRRYRPHSFKELVGHGMVKEVVRGALRSEELSGCWLFHGPYGTGKTSLVRLTAASLLCTSERTGVDACGRCAACEEVFSGSEEALDYREADCGNNTGADDARALAAWIAQHPVRGGLRVVALDEVHRLSTAASSVFLKSLEEPPPHVVFLLATTDPEKVMPTIRSRAISLQLRPLATSEVIGRLEHVAQVEGIKAGPEVFQAIAQSCGGHLRDALQELQRLAMLGRPLSLEDIWASSSKLPPRQAGRLAKALIEGDAVGVLEQSRALLSEGLLARSVVLGMEQVFRDCFVLSQVTKAEHLVSLPAELLPKFQLLASLVPPATWRALLAATDYTVKRLGVHTGREELLLDVWLLELLQVASKPQVASPAPAAGPAAAPAAEDPDAVPRRVERKVAKGVVSEPPEIPTDPAPQATVPVVDSDVAALIGCLRNRNLQMALRRCSGFDVGQEVVAVVASTDRHRQALTEAVEEIGEAFSALLGRTVRFEVG